MYIHILYIYIFIDLFICRQVVPPEDRAEGHPVDDPRVRRGPGLGVYVCVYVCVYIYIYVFVYTHMYVCISLSLYTYIV